MKILTITHLATLYGANKSLLNLIEGTGSEVEWIVVCKGFRNKNSSLKSELQKMGVKCYNIPYRLDVHSKSSKFTNTKAFFLMELLYNFIIAFFLSVYALIKGINFIHSNSSCICLGAYVSCITNKPHIWHFREFLKEDYRLDYNFGFKYLVFWANKSFRVIAISNAILKKCVLDRGITTSAIVISNGVIYQKELKSPGLKKFSSPLNLLIIGILDDSKNQIDAIKAVDVLINKRIDVKLNIVGGKAGDYYKTLEEYVELRNLNNYITFTPYISSPRSVFENSDITLMCSKNEGMGRVTIESMAYGTPVIGYDSAGTSELIVHKENGLLYKGGGNELACMIETLVSDRQLIDKVTIGGYESVLSKYTVERYSANFLNAIA